MGIFDKFSKKKSTAPKAVVKKEKEVADKDKELVAKDEKKAIGSLKKTNAASFAYGIIRQPISTEKTDRGQMNGKYTFIVMRGANKVEVARAVKELYGVKPTSVRIINTLGKTVRFGRSVGRHSNRKKAIVTLKPGDSLKIAE